MGSIPIARSYFSLSGVSQCCPRTRLSLSHSLDAATTVLDRMRRFPPSVEFVLDGLIRRSIDLRGVGGGRCYSVYRYANNLGLAQKGNPALRPGFSSRTDGSRCVILARVTMFILCSAPSRCSTQGRPKAFRSGCTRKVARGFLGRSRSPGSGDRHVVAGRPG